MAYIQTGCSDCNGTCGQPTPVGDAGWTTLIVTPLVIGAALLIFTWPTKAKLATRALEAEARSRSAAKRRPQTSVEIPA